MSFESVPWRTAAEWRTVFSNIYGPESTTESKRCALETMLMWKIRDSELPSGIESTLTLLEVELQYKESSSCVTNDHFLRLAYSSAIMRFVNHMLDNEISKGLSLYQAARNKKIDQWIIDLRHDTAHNSTLPSLKLLLKATESSMGWLMRNYWEPHSQIISDYVVEVIDLPDVDQKYIERLCSYYITLSVCSCSSAKVKNLNDIEDEEMRTSLIQDGIILHADSPKPSKFLTLSILKIMRNVENIISKAVRETKSGEQLITEVIVGEDSPFISLELFQYYHGSCMSQLSTLNSSYVQMWQPLLTFLHSNDLLQQLVERLIQLSLHGESESQRLAALWVKEILHALKKCEMYKSIIDRLQKQSNPTYDYTNKDEIIKLLYHHSPNEKNRLTLNLNHAVPSAFTSYIYVKNLIKTLNPFLYLFISELLELLKPKLRKDTVGKILKLSQAIIGSQYQTPSDDSKLHTINDIVKKSCVDILPNCDESSDCMIVDDEEGTCEPVTAGVWTMASSGVEWSQCAIGVLPQTVIVNGP